MRSKIVCYGGHEFRLASLKLGQVEALLAEEEQTGQMQTRVVLDSLANAGEAYDAAFLHDTLDLEDFRSLYEDVLTISALLRRKNLETENKEPLDFSFIRCHLVHTLHWTFAQADDSAFSDCMDMFEHWADFPPQHVLMAGYVGFNPQRRKDTSGAEMAKAVSELGGQLHQSIDTLPLEMQGILAKGLGLFGEPKPEDIESLRDPEPLP